MTDQDKAESLSGKAARKKCFVIMPISTPESYSSRFLDLDHFKHILESLFLPAIDRAGLDPVKPIATGADLIHLRTIREIEQDDLVLCDISSYNPNVFFELGIRTALDMPVCLVKDDLTDRIPFDMAGINHHTYRSALSRWDSDQEITDLAAHISKSFDGSNKGNALWKAFSLSAVANRLDKNIGPDEQIGYLTRLVESLVNEIRSIPRRRPDIGAIQYQGPRPSASMATGPTGPADPTFGVWGPRLTGAVGPNPETKDVPEK